MLIKHITEGWPDTHDQCPDLIHDYFTFRYELSVANVLVLKESNHIVIPKSLVSDALNKLYFSYLGSTKTILRARTSVLWPGLNADMKEITANCQECAKYAS